MAGPAHAEVIPEADDKSGSGDSSELNERGLTAEEQAQFDDMMRETSGDPPAPGPAGDTPAPAAGEEPAPGDGDDEDEDDGEEAPPAAAAAPAEGETAAAPKDGTAKPPRKTVSYSKYLREQNKLKQQLETLGQETARERADRIKLGERLAILNEALTAGAPAEGETAPANPLEEEDIDPNVDVWKALDQSNRRIKYLAQNFSGMAEQTAEERADTELRSAYLRDTQAYAAQTPDFLQAYEYLKDSRLVDIALTEFDKDPRDPNAQFTEAEIGRIVQLFNEEEKWLVSTNLEKRRSPAAAIYKLAQSRGYQKAAPAKGGATPAPAPAPAASKPANGAAASQPRKAPVVNEVERLRAAQENGRSLSDGGSTADVTALTPDRLLAMNDDEFNALVDRLPKRQLESLMGRDAAQ